MNAKTITSAVILSFAAIGAAQAATPRGDTDNTPFQGTYAQADTGASRAQVLAQLQQARANGVPALAESNNQPFAAQPQGAAPTAAANTNAVHDVAFGDIDNQPFQGA